MINRLNMKKAIRTIIIIIVSLVSLLIIAFYVFTNSFSKSFGGNIGMLGCITDLDSSNFSIKNLIKFREKYPIYNVPDSLKSHTEYRSLDYEHLQLSTYILNEDEPIICFIQWREKCSNVRFIYYPNRGRIVHNFYDWDQDIEEIDKMSKEEKKEINEVINTINRLIVPKLTKK